MNESRTGAIVITMTSFVKVMLMPLVLWALAGARPWIAVGVTALISLIAILERMSTALLPRVISALANRIALIPVLVYLAAQEIAIMPQFPILMVLGCVFIIVKEMFFVYRSMRYLIWDEEYLTPRFTQKLNAAALAVVVALYCLRWEPYNDLAMIAVIVIGIIDFFAFVWSIWKKRRGIRDINLATRITLMRLLISPVFLIVYFYDRNSDFSDNSLLLQIVAVTLSVFFVVTDGLDGYFARKRNEVTKLGKYLDPFSDKICTTTIFLCFVASNYVPVWMVAFIYYREASISVIRTLAAAENVVIAARPSGKWKTALQGTAIITILVLATVLSELSRSAFPSLYPGVYADLLLVWNYVPFSLMALVTLVTVVSGVDYVLACRDILDKYFK